MYDDKYKSILITSLVKSDIDYRDNLGASIETYRFGGWKFARKKMIQLKNKNKREVSLSLAEDSSTDDEPITAIIREENRISKSNLIQSILTDEALTNLEKKYLEMIYSQGLSRSQIAKMLGVTKQAVSYTEQKALGKLREIYVS
jgi:RNA polymerase sigma factor (sigma-70 family)